ncbi:MAG: copper resistance system multicopper oxidase [Sphingomonadales bacterium]|nr:copper resistance system multicopper oxidase [Sphingomonadales bacterium]
MPSTIDRRGLLSGALALGGGLAASSLLPGWARAQSHGHHRPMAAASPGVLSGEEIALTIGETRFTVGGRTGHAITVNGTLPAPLIRLREGQNLRIAVTNHLDADSSIHWHGLLLPFEMDGVPGVSFPGIRPHETFTYEFPVRQAGTYWYHSHSDMQEAMGHYGPIVIDPAHRDPVAYDREHVLVLSDWSFMHPHTILRKLKQSPDYFNRQQNTLFDGREMSAEERLMWGGMRMMPSDIADVTGATYSYLVNGHGPRENWTGLFEPGERVRLRIINASAMSNFNIRIPDLPMIVVNADGENVRPVETDELQIGVAETYDVIVTPTENRAYGFIAESIDRSGLTRATLAPRPGMTAPVPPLRERPTLTMRDMGMAMAGGHAEHGSTGGGMDHGEMDMRDGDNAPQVALTPGVEMIAPMPAERIGDRGLGLEEVDHRVLVYTDLEALAPNPDPRPPSRDLEIHLTGNMERYMWGFDGRKFSEIVEPIRFARNERVRVKLVNDTMMTHPIHLHGHFFELVNGHPGRQPRKHTVNVLPGGFIRFDLTADAPGDWAFHCHLLMHMHAGMFNVVTVRPMEGEAA